MTNIDMCHAIYLSPKNYCNTALLRLLSLLCIMLLPVNTMAQERLIKGQITNQDKAPVVGAKVAGRYGETISDLEGRYFIAVSDDEDALTVSSMGYKTQVVLFNQATSHLDITLEEQSTGLSDQNTVMNMEVPDNYKSNKTEVYMSMGFHLIDMNFDEFEPPLGSSNVDFINGANITLDLGIGGSVNRHYYKFIFGIMSNTDSIEGLEYNTTKYKLDYGYNIIDTKHFRFRPVASINWYRFRLLNYNPAYEILLTEYLSERDLDIRINQMTGNLGGELEFKFRNYDGRYYSLILYGGYHFKINQNPWIYSQNNRLKTKANYDLHPLTLGLTFSFNVGG